MTIVERSDKGWCIKTRFLTFHPVSYGVGSLARLSIGIHPDGRRLMVHYFPRTVDAPERFHNHPWSFTTLVLWGSYTDESSWPGYTPESPPYIQQERLRIGSVRHREASHRHRTYVHSPTVTLVFRGPTVQDWCEGSAVDWKCEGDPADFDATLGRSEE